MFVKLKGKKLRDIYKREIKDGDYVLFYFSYGDDLYFKTVGLYSSNSLFFSDNIDLDSFYTPEINTICYKIENPSDLGLDLSHINSLISQFYLKNENYYSDIIDKPIHDIFGRQLGLGDFVVYKTVGNKFHYGLVVDDRHVFTNKLIKKKATAVYKVVTPIMEEQKIYENLKSEYQKLQNSLLIGSQETKKRFKNLTIGDCFRKNNNLYIYMGDFYFRALYSKTHVSNFSSIMSTSVVSDIDYLTDDVKELQNKYVKFYLCLNIEHNKTKEFINRLRTNNLSQTQFENYVVSCGLKYGYNAYDCGLPRIFKFNLTERRLGTYVENFDISNFKLCFRYNPYVPKYNSLYYLFNDSGIFLTNES